LFDHESFGVGLYAAAGDLPGWKELPPISVPQLQIKQHEHALPNHTTMSDAKSPLVQSSEKSSKEIKKEVKETILREKLAQAEPLQDVLKKYDRPDDCMPCRVMGKWYHMGLLSNR